MDSSTITALQPTGAKPKRRVVAIDGGNGTGKSSTAKLLAELCGFVPINTGYLYRAIARECLEQGVQADHVSSIVFLAEELVRQMRFDSGRLFVDGEEMNDGILKTEPIRLFTPKVAKIPAVRAAIRPLQRAQATNDVVAVLEGRDIGTVVFPDAMLKFWLTCDPDEIIRRELKRLGLDDSHWDKIAQAIRDRDAEDAGHGDGRMLPAEDAVHIDTTGREIEDVVGEMTGYCAGRGLYVLGEPEKAAVA